MKMKPTETSCVLAAGDVLEKCYRVVSFIGSGGMAEVYDVVHLQLGAHFALKVFTLAEGEVEYLREHFYAEGRLLARLRHRHVVRVVHLGEIEESRCVYFIMDLVTLPLMLAREIQRDPSALLKKQKDVADREKTVMTLGDLLRLCGRLPYPVVRHLFRDICQGLAYVHGMGVIHRDLKLENILLDAEGRAVLADFGIAKIINPTLLRAFSTQKTLLNTAQGKTMVGSCFYLAPELTAGDSATVKSDLYALGVLLYRLLTANWYEGGAHCFSKLGELPTAWAKPLRRMLAQNPDYRAASVAEIVALSPSESDLRETVFTRRRCLIALSGAVAAGVGAGVYRGFKPAPTAPKKLELLPNENGAFQLSGELNEHIVLHKRGAFSLEIEPDATGKLELTLDREPPKSVTFFDGARAEVRLFFQKPTDLSAMQATVSGDCLLILAGMFGAAAPAARLSHESTLRFEGDAQTRLTLSNIVAPSKANVIVGGKGAIFSTHNQAEISGVIRVEGGATLHIEHSKYKKPFGVEAFDGATVAFGPRADRWWQDCVRFIHLHKGTAMKIAPAERQMMTWGRWELWDGARIETKSALITYGHAIILHSGTGTLEGERLLLASRDPLYLQAEKGAELLMKIGILSHEHFEGAPIRKQGPGRVTFQSEDLQSVTYVVVEQGSLCLRSKWVQKTENHFEKPHRPCSWYVKEGAVMLGTGGIEFRRRFSGEQPRHPSLEVEKGAVLEGGIEGEGVFTVSHLTLHDGAIIRLVSPKGKTGQGKIENEVLAQDKQPGTVWIDLSRWAPPHSTANRIQVIAWSKAEGTPHRFAVLPNLNDGRAAWRCGQNETGAYLYV